MRRWEIIEQVAKNNGGLISTKDAENIGISRTMISKYAKCGKLERIRNGIYALPTEIVDEYSLMQAQSQKIIYSYGTALYLWGLSDRTPHSYDLTVPWGTNTTHLKSKNKDLKFHYATDKFYEVGLTQTQTPQGGTVKLYDKERCICDLVRSKRKVDMQLFTDAIKNYFRTMKNPRKLLKYGKLFEIEDELRTYMEVMD